AANCSNDNVKRAFLISCLTGLRFCDVKLLKWRNINGEVIDLIQQKTKQRVLVKLNPDAKRLLGEVKSLGDLIFSLPTHNGANKVLSGWVKRAGITKHITWHSARHTFGTNLVQLGADVMTTSKLLGHSSIRSTTRYVRINDVLKTDAVNRFPRIF
ncbi:MAG TPA: site-specific integrase, partial [Puia sp.]